jgi:ABC-type branched-subunit amino acid transport system substrate-binding protein
MSSLVIRRRRASSALVVVLATAVAATAAFGASSRPTASVLTIGQMISLTGVNATICYDQVRGAAIAVAEAAHLKEKVTVGGKTKTVPYLRGVGVKVDTQDDQSTAAGGVTSFRAITGSDAIAFAGPCSSTPALAAQPLVDDAKMPQVISNAGLTTLVDPKYTFRAGIPQPYFNGRVIQVLKGMGVKSVFLIDATDNPTLVEIESAVQRTLKVLGIKVDKYDVTARTLDWTPVIQQIQQTHPDAVGVYVGGNQVATAPTAIRNAGLSQIIFGSQALYTDAYLKGGAFAKNGILPTSYSSQLPYASSKRFEKEFTAKYPDIASSPIAAAGYDAMWRILRAIHDAGPQKLAGMSTAAARVLMQQTLAAQKTAQTAQGPVKYLPSGDVSGQAAVVQATDGNGGVKILKVPTVAELLHKKK